MFIFGHIDTIYRTPDIDVLPQHSGISEIVPQLRIGFDEGETERNYTRWHLKNNVLRSVPPGVKCRKLG